jgi:hypothetical protein
MICAKLNDLTDRQWMMLTFISDYIMKHKYSPTSTEIIEYFQRSLPVYPMTKSICHDELVRLKMAGRINFVHGQPRTITLERPVPTFEYYATEQGPISKTNPFNEIPCHICGRLINKNLPICFNCDTIAKVYV